MYAEGETFRDYPEYIKNSLEVAFQAKMSTIEFTDINGQPQKFSVNKFIDETKATEMKRILGMFDYILSATLLCHMYFTGGSIDR